MTESESNTNLLQAHFNNNLPSDPAVDPDASNKGNPDAIWKMREAEQAHGFRSCAFGCAVTFCVILAFVWLCFLVFSWPCGEVTLAVVVLYGVKSSLMTVVLITLAVSTMRFAIECYGHHLNKKEATEVSDNPIKEIAKVFLEIGKEGVKALKQSHSQNF